MGTSRRRAARQRLTERAGDQVERTGGRALLWLWSRAVRALFALLAAFVDFTLAAGRRFVRLRARTQFLILASLPLVWWLLGIAWAAIPERPVYESDETEALARVIRSEVGGQSPQQRLHVAWATRNLAGARGQSIARMACSPCGRQGPGRPVSTRQPASDDERSLAALVLASPQIMDPTAGATHFLNPRLQDELARNGSVPGYFGNTYEVVRKRWMASYDWAPYYRLGPDLEFWGPKKAARGAR